MKNTLVTKKISQSSLDALKSDDAFCEASRESLTSTKNVKTRIERAKQLIRFE